MDTVMHPINYSKYQVFGCMSLSNNYQYRMNQPGDVFFVLKFSLQGKTFPVNTELRYN